MSSEEEGGQDVKQGSDTIKTRGQGKRGSYHDGVRRSNASTSQHGDHKVQDHGLVDGNRVALLHAQAFEDIGKALHPVEEARVRDFRLLAQRISLPVWWGWRGW